MDPARVHILLATWERTNASLGACRAALDASAWNAAIALAKLDALELPPSAVGPPGDARDTSAAAAARLVSGYKTVARELDRVAKGTLPRSLVWVTEQSVAPPDMPRWERHRYFLGAPHTRAFAGRHGASSGPRSLGGHLRIERDPDAVPHASRDEEARLALHDVRWVMERLARCARRSGLRVAVELRGKSGWIDAAGCDATLEQACSRHVEDLDRKAVWDLLDQYPDRRTDVDDCGWAAAYEEDLLRAVRVLRDVDLEEDAFAVASGHRAAIEAAAKAPIYELCVARAPYRTTRRVFADVLDRLLLEYGSGVIGPAWREVPREEALATWRAMLTTTLAYGSPIMDTNEAERLALAFAASFGSGALFFRNGDDSAYRPVLGTTLEKGAAVVDSTSVGILFVGDED